MSAPAPGAEDAAELRIVPVELGARAYEVMIGEGILHRLPERMAAVMRPTTCFLLVDQALLESRGRALLETLRSAGYAARLIPIPSGEGSKSFARLQQLLETMLSEQPDRRCCVIALGGGVVGDLGGFVASLLLRGVDFIQLPTTLLAMVDSSVGGKTAINSAHGKNLIGAFWQPRLVLADLALLVTLPAREWRAGYAEVVKYAALGDAAFFDWLELHGQGALRGQMSPLREMVAHCVAMKAAIVRQDEREAGRRALLNLGHTLGHAFEAECGFDGSLLHGEAVALGMVFAFRLAQALGMAEASAGTVLTRHLAQAGLPVHPHAIRPEWDEAALLRHCHGDKKTEGGKLTFILPRALGICEVVKDVPPNAVRDCLRAWLAGAA